MGGNKKIGMLYQQHQVTHRQENGLPISYRDFVPSYHNRSNGHGFTSKSDCSIQKQELGRFQAIDNPIRESMMINC